MNAIDTRSKVGVTSKGTPEFGEIYHTVIGKRLNARFFPEFVDFRDGEDFFDLFASIEKRRGATKIHLGETANWIFQGYHSGIGAELWVKIEKLAKKEQWAKQIPDVFKGLLTNDPKILIWLRSKDYQSHRNTSLRSVEQLVDRCKSRRVMPVFIGPRLKGLPDGSIGLWDFYKDPFFKEHNIAKQLWCLNHLYEHGGVIASLGMMSGAMDGLAMICGKKVVFLARKEDATPRMVKVAAAVPDLHWVELSYPDKFLELSEGEMAEIEKRIFA